MAAQLGAITDNSFLRTSATFVATSSRQPSPSTDLILFGKIAVMICWVSTREPTLMKLHTGISVGERRYPPGHEVPWYYIYPFFLIYVGAIGGVSFVAAYRDPESASVFMFGVIMLAGLTPFYVAIFGRDEIKWMFINAALGLFGTYSQVGWVLSLFDRKIGDYPFYAHVVPFLYFVMYTFLVRHAFLDLFHARGNPARERVVGFVYVAVSLGVSVFCFFLERS